MKIKVKMSVLVITGTTFVLYNNLDGYLKRIHPHCVSDTTIHMYLQFCKQCIFFKGTNSYMFQLIIHHWGFHIRRYDSCYLLMRTAQRWLIS